MIRNQSVAITETAIVSAITIILILASTFFPLLGFLSFIVAVPFIVVGVKHELKYAVMGVVVTSIIVGMLTSVFQFLSVLFLGGIPSLIIIYMTQKKYKTSAVILSSTVGATIGFMILLALASYVLEIGFIDQIELSFQQSMEIIKTIETDQAVTAQTESMLNELLNVLKMVLPSILLVMGLLYSYINHFFASLILKRMGSPIVTTGKFSEFSLPSNILLGTTIILGLSFVVSYFNIVDTQVLFMNILTIFLYVYLIQGLAVLFHLLDRYNVKNGLKILIFIGILLINGAFILSILGWLDMLFNFRKLDLSNR